MVIEIPYLGELLERVEYEYYVDVDDVIGLLKAKARRVLGRLAL